ncbi:MAG: ABC transporter ATP-binding protein [Acidimicrobiia bacterium]|nr:ABC transporter ATP-binding protein [Acidimicrobiia bacterium]
MQWITFNDVTKRFGSVTALDRLSFQIPGGRLTGFLGPNGAGKTTSFRAALGLTRLTNGTIEIFSMKVGPDNADIVKQVGAVVEGPGHHEGLTARDNLRIAAHELGRGHEQIDDLLERVGLAEVGGRKVGGFSKGMAQRLGVAAAMLGDPQILFLDEPLDGLDPAGQVAFKAQLRSMVVDEGRTVVVSSHDLADVEELADHIVVIDRGQLVIAGDKTELLGDVGRYRVEVEQRNAAADALRKNGFEVHEDEEGLAVATDDGAAISRTLAGVGLYPSSLVPKASSLEEMFLRLTNQESNE